MSIALEEFTLRAIYHALGANLYTGLAEFDRAFLEAERNLRFEDADRLWEVLKDPMLMDEQLWHWRVYYEARLQCLKWQTGPAEETLKKLPTKLEGEVKQRLQPYLDVLYAKICASKEEWGASQTYLTKVISLKNGAVPDELLVDGFLTRAQVSLYQAQSLGGWADPWEGRGGQAARWLLRLTLLPVYLLLWSGLALARCGIFQRAALQHGADYSNWPVFRHYLDAHLALRQAEKLIKPPGREPPIMLEILRLELFGKLEFYETIEKTCKAHLNDPESTLNDHQKASLTLRLAEAQLKMKRTADLEAIGLLIDTAAAAFRECHDLYSLTQSQILRGGLQLASGQTMAALEAWKTVMDDLSHERSADGEARYSLLKGEILNQCYALNAAPASEQEKAIIATIISSAGKQVFYARIPETVFIWLQILSWVIPPLFLIGNSVVNVVIIQNSSVLEFRQLVAAIFSEIGLRYFLVGSRRGDES